MTNLFHPNTSKSLQTVAVVCRANEVRSRIVEAYLNLVLGSCQVRSYGTNIRRNAKVSSDFVTTMHNWGLRISTHTPRHIESDISYLRSADLVIAADFQVFESVKELSLNCINLIDFALDENHEPIDPIGLPRGEFLENISKVIHCTSRLVDLLTPPLSNLHEILAVIPKTSHLVQYPKNEGFVIDSSFGGSQRTGQSNLNVLWFSESDFRSGNILNLVRENVSHYSSKYEFLKPEQVLISESWAKFVKKVASMGPTEVITQPFGSKGSEMWQPYLASRFAHAVRYD